MRLAVIASHPVQYYAPLYRTLAQRLELTVFYGHRATAVDQAQAGFGVGFQWDVDLLSGYRHAFLHNVARHPGLTRFTGIDTPDIGARLRDVDAVLLMGWNFKCFHQALWAAKWRHLPVMVRGDSQLSMAQSRWKRVAKDLLYPLFLRSFDAALFVGDRNRAYWRHYGYPRDRLFYAPHCVDQAWFAARAGGAARAGLRAQLGVGARTRLVLFAGKLVPFKRPLDVIEAVARLRAEGDEVEVLVAGAGPLAEPMRRRALELGLPLHLLGFCNQSHMPAVYAAADLLVLPSDGRETWGLVVNEALACGCPVVLCAEVGCAPDMAAVLGPEILFPPGDLDRLAAALRYQLQHPVRAETLVNAGARFSLERAADGVLQGLAGLRGKTC